MEDQTQFSPASAAAPRSGPASLDRYPIPAIKGNSTRRFAPVLGLTLLLWIGVWPFFTLGFINHYDSADAAWVQGLYQRKDLSVQRPPLEAGGGRIIIVGGSGALFGIDAELIEKRLGVTTINYATHAGLGTYILDRARTVVRSGDTVLLCPEYELWYTQAGDLPEVEWAYVCTYDKRFIWSQGIGGGLRTLYSQPLGVYEQSLLGWRNWYKGFDSTLSGEHNLALIDPWGDLRGVPPRREFPPQGDPAFADAANSAFSIGDFQSFSRWARANQVRVLYSWPNTCRQTWPRGAPPGAVAAPASTRALLNDLGFIALDEPGDNFYPRDWFTDTAYHPDAGCRRVRTESLIRRMRPYFAPAPSAGRPLTEQPQGVYLVAGETNWLRPGNTFADRPGVQVKYLSTQAMDCPDAITPADVAALAARGVPIWFDDPAILSLLPSDRWDVVEVDKIRESLADWLARYQHHLFLLARVGRPHEDAPHLPSGLPPDVRAALAGAGPAVAIFGTGPLAGVQRTRTDARTAIIELRSTTVVGHPAPNLALLARADAPRANGVSDPSRVQANTKALYFAPAGLTAVAVIDPEQGIMVDCGAFEGAETKTVWSLWKLSLRRPRER